MFIDIMRESEMVLDYANVAYPHPVDAPNKGCGKTDSPCHIPFFQKRN